MSPTSRRHFFRDSALLSASLFLIESAFATHAFAADIKPELQSWLKRLFQLCGDLKQDRLSPGQWQDQLADLYQRVSLADLMYLIDFEKLVAGLQFEARGATIRALKLPEPQGLRRPAGMGTKIFTMQKGQAVIPHAHNHMVSSHLVLAGSFHVRTWDRDFQRETAGDALYLKPSRDSHFKTGQLLTMSDDRDNIHWLEATSTRAYTLDIPISGLYRHKAYPTPANRYGLIFVDPTGRADRDGLVRAPILDITTALQRFGAR